MVTGFQESNLTGPKTIRSRQEMSRILTAAVISAQFRQMLLANYPSRDAEVNFEHAAKQAYIGLTAAMISAAFEGVDCTPMEGFDPKGLDELLGLRAKGLRSVVILPLGYREADKDWLVNLKKVRRPIDQFITVI